jgi:AcrR family transcriptional regulator
MGRHREFDVEEALDAVVRVFWRRGYDGASYDDLTAATGVKRPGLYSAFGNKEELFRRALERYSEQYMTYVKEALDQQSSFAMAEHILRGVVQLTTQFPDSLGCLGVNGALTCSEASEPIYQLLVEFRSGGEADLRQRLEAFQASGDLPNTADYAGLATYLMAVIHGMAVQAKSGVPREGLEKVVEQTLAGWPRPPKKTG